MIILGTIPTGFDLLIIQAKDVLTSRLNLESNLVEEKNNFKLGSPCNCKQTTSADCEHETTNGINWEQSSSLSSSSSPLKRRAELKNYP